MQQLTKAKRHVYLTAKKHYPSTLHHNHKTLKTETLYVKNGGIQLHNALKSVICHIYTAPKIGIMRKNTNQKEWMKKVRKVAREVANNFLFSFVSFSSAGKGFLLCHYVSACRSNTGAATAHLSYSLWLPHGKNQRDFFKKFLPWKKP